MSAPAACVPAAGVYKPRRPQASPLFRLVSEHFRAFHDAYEDRFAHTYGDWRPVMREVADKFLACGVLAHGFARVRCDACTHEYLLAFSCKARYFCPSCHAKRLALWTLWLEESLLAPGVPHRQVVLTIPKRLRAWCLYRRTLLGDLARVAARTVTAAVRTLTGEPQLAVGIVGCIQTHGSLANWHPHIHMIVTDGGFRPDGTFVPWPAHDTAQLTEAFRRAVLRRFVRRGLFEQGDADAMLAWPHSGFHVHDAVLVPDGDMAFALRLARYCARNPVALERLEYDARARKVRYRSDKAHGPTAGTETVDPLEFLARLTAHIPNKGQVMTRYYGYYANRVRGARRLRGAVPEEPPPIAEPVPLALREARRRWAELLRQIYEVDPLRCPACGAEMRIVAFITQRAVIDRILDHLRRTRESARGPPSVQRRGRAPAERLPACAVPPSPAPPGAPAGTRRLRGCGGDRVGRHHPSAEPHTSAPASALRSALRHDAAPAHSPLTQRLEPSVGPPLPTLVGRLRLKYLYSAIGVSAGGVSCCVTAGHPAGPTGVLLERHRSQCSSQCLTLTRRREGRSG